MKKKNDGVVAGTTAVAKVRKSTKGMPRITDKVIAMSETDRAAWLAKVPAEHLAGVEARLKDVLANGRTSTGKGHKVDFGKLFAGRTVAEFGDLQLQSGRLIPCRGEFGLQPLRVIGNRRRHGCRA